MAAESLHIVGKKTQPWQVLVIDAQGEKVIPLTQLSTPELGAIAQQLETRRDMQAEPDPLPLMTALKLKAAEPQLETEKAALTIRDGRFALIADKNE